MTSACLLCPVLSLALLGVLVAFAAPARAEIPGGVVRYVTKAVAAQCHGAPLFGRPRRMTSSRKS